MTTTMAPEDYVTGSGTALIYYQIDIYFSNIYITIFTLFFFIFYLINVRIKLLIQYKVQKKYIYNHFLWYAYFFIYKLFINNIGHDSFTEKQYIFLSYLFVNQLLVFTIFILFI
jgi:hypothetical protein